ncbi:hypothetical protein I302_102816 [Kwoniella bestiolae CBS 10118]|uniref:Uncharacterized protein n=1 Tax=Kwoniella bestiolae CBS 10118 TaxID=1296100 RepID=A0A1B9GG19_9TREE|nr:hypothetical protein I302_01511 [Kwoniella bestiolae CBS 10118]OCF29994.1 hypothetical protein I302_01511 [Kwoniella bestiolae CBS 10118]
MKYPLDIVKILSAGGQEGTPTICYLKDLDRKVACLNSAPTEIPKLRTALSDDEQGLAELKRIENVLDEVRSTLPEIMTTHMNALHADQVAKWNEELEASEYIAKRANAAHGKVIVRWIERVSHSLWHQDHRAAAALISICGEVTNDSERAKAYQEASTEWQRLAGRLATDLQVENDKFVSDFKDAFGSEAKIPSTADEWQKLCSGTPAASRVTAGEMYDDVPPDYYSYFRMSRASGPCSVFADSQTSPINIWPFGDPTSLPNSEDATDK